MAKAVLLSIKPKWANLIFEGKKKIEVRKTQPKLIKDAFKVYLYVTGTVKHVIGECECYYIPFLPIYTIMHRGKELWSFDIKDTCLTEEELREYANGGSLYGWHLRNVTKYDNPKTLADFGVKRPPQSWCYVNWREQDGEAD